MSIIRYEWLNFGQLARTNACTQFLSPYNSVHFFGPYEFPVWQNLYIFLTFSTYQ